MILKAPEIICDEDRKELDKILADMAEIEQRQGELLEKAERQIDSIVQRAQQAENANVIYRQVIERYQTILTASGEIIQRVALPPDPIIGHQICVIRKATDQLQAMAEHVHGSETE